MQQQGLVAIDGQGMSVQELEEEALAAVLRAAEEGITSLAGSGSIQIRFLRTVQASAVGLLAVSTVPQSLLG
jgi:hypothetical protein